MFRSLARFLGLNPLDPLLRSCAKRGGRRILLGWNRGLGDIALGLFAIVHRIRRFIPDAEIVFITRENLLCGFSMLEGVKAYGAPDWRRGSPYDLKQTAKLLGLDYKSFDLVIERPSPTDWCAWQHGKLTPRMKWRREFDHLCEKFRLPDEYTYIGVQVSAETNYGLWRNWPLQRWEEFFNRIEKMGHVRVLVFGYGNEPLFSHSNVFDLRGKTSLFELLAIIKKKCAGLVLPDSGISSMTYYLDEPFPLRFVTLWADTNHGILKQGVPSPNPMLTHIPLVGPDRDLSQVSADQVIEALFPKREWKPLQRVAAHSDLALKEGVQNTACVIVAGGQGSRLGVQGPKGLFSILGKPLFQRLVEKVPADMPIAVMTSPENRALTESYFAENGCFGRKVYFFSQSTLALLDDTGKAGAFVSDGNGSIYKGLVESGLAQQFERDGIDCIMVVPVDNPLADPGDAAFLGYHRERRFDVTVKCIERHPGESMGVLVEEGDGIRVAEYIELSEQQLQSPAFKYAYIGQVALSLDFVIRAAEMELPLHWVKKRGMWKREKFLFDAFEAAKTIGVVCYPRKMCYAPVKGIDCVSRVEAQLQEAES